METVKEVPETPCYRLPPQAIVQLLDADLELEKWWRSHQPKIVKRFRKILFVPSSRLAEPDDSFKKVVKLAADNDALLTVFGVIYDQQVSEEFINDLIYHERLPELSTLATHAQQRNVVANFKLVSGIPFIKIIREVIQHGHDLVVTHLVRGRSVKDWLFGGTNMHLLRKCPTPVWIMKPKEKERYQQVLAAVDPCSPPPAKPGLNRRIVEMAASMTAREQGKLHLLHAWSPEG